jgi:hypothetical protein
MSAGRVYRIEFDWYINYEWNKGGGQRTVIVRGGAESAIRVALERERRYDPKPRRLRARTVTLLTEEDE